MPPPSSPTDSLMSPTSETFAPSPVLQSLSDAVYSRLLLLAGSPVSRTAPQASDLPAPTSEISGTNAFECFGNYDPALPSSRMSEDSSVPKVLPMPRMVVSTKGFFSTEYCRTWPKSGMLARGKLYQLPTWERPTDESASGSSASTSWPTAASRDYKGESGAGRQERKGHPADTLPNAVMRQWPTASARDYKDTPGMAQTGTNPDGSERSRTDQLARAVYAESGPPPVASGPHDPARHNSDGSRQGSSEEWKTPQASDGEGGTMEWMGDKDGHYKLRYHVHKGTPKPQITGKLNPDWVETLMGLPIGWTQLPTKFQKPRTERTASKPSATASCPPSPTPSPLPSDATLTESPHE